MRSLALIATDQGKALLKVCDTHDIPLATNLATADLILDHLVEAHAHGN